MTLDDNIFEFIAGLSVSPSDRDIQIHFGLKDTDQALGAINRLISDGRIRVNQEGSRRVIYCASSAAQDELLKQQRAYISSLPKKNSRPFIAPVALIPDQVPKSKFKKNRHKNVV